MIYDMKSIHDTKYIYILRILYCVHTYVHMNVFIMRLHTYVYAFFFFFKVNDFDSEVKQLTIQHPEVCTYILYVHTYIRTYACTAV